MTAIVLLSLDEWQFAIDFLNNVVIFSKSPDDHIDHEELLLTLLIDAVVTRKLKKSEFFTHRVDYLVHVIKPELLETR